MFNNHYVNIVHKTADLTQNNLKQLTLTEQKFSRWVSHNTDLRLNSNISKTVRVIATLTNTFLKFEIF